MGLRLIDENERRLGSPPMFAVISTMIFRTALCPLLSVRNVYEGPRSSVPFGEHLRQADL